MPVSRLALIGALVVLVAAAIVGCSGGDGSTTSSVSATSSTSGFSSGSGSSSTSESSTAATQGPNDPRMEVALEWFDIETVPEADVQTIGQALRERGLCMLFPPRISVAGAPASSADFSLQRVPATGVVTMIVGLQTDEGSYLTLVSSVTRSEWFPDGAETAAATTEVVVRGQPGWAFPPTAEEAEFVFWQEDGQYFAAYYRGLGVELTAESVIAWLDSWHKLPDGATGATGGSGTDTVAGPALYLAHADDGTWGFVDANGTWAIGPRFYFCYEFSEGLAAVLGDRQSLYGYIDQTGNIVIPAELADAKEFSEGLAAVFLAGEDARGYGYIEKTGRLVIPVGFGNAGPFREGRAAVRVDDKWGYIDQTGAWAVVPRFGEALAFSDGLAAVWVRDEDLAPGGTLQTTAGTQTGSAASLAAAVPLRPIGKWGYIDRDGTFIIEPRYEDATTFSEGLAAVRADAAWGYIDQTETFVTQPMYWQALPFSEGLAAVQVDRGWGFVDRTGEWALEPRYLDATTFSEGLAAVETEDGWGYIDQSGTFVIEPQFDSAQPFSGALALVYTDSSHQVWGYIDRTGAVVWTRSGSGD